MASPPLEASFAVKFSARKGFKPMGAIESPAILKVRSDRFHETKYSIYGNCLIGRHSKNDVTLKDKAVSKVHALIMPVDKSYLIRNLESRNGVYVNGKRVQEVVLKDGDEIKIGITRMVFIQKVQFEESSWPQGSWESIVAEMSLKMEEGNLESTPFQVKMAL